MTTCAIIPVLHEPDIVRFIDSVALYVDDVITIVDERTSTQTAMDCEETHVRAPGGLAQAYVSGYREALKRGHSIIIEIDAGGTHDPNQIPIFINAIRYGFDCAYGSRFCVGGEYKDKWKVGRLISRLGGVLSCAILGIRSTDATSGYQAFTSKSVECFYNGIKSTGRFIQTEIKYRCKKLKAMEIPISYERRGFNLFSGEVAKSLWTMTCCFLFG